MEVTGTGEDGIVVLVWNSGKSRCSLAELRGWLKLPGDTKSDRRLGIKWAWNPTTARV